MKFSKAKDTLVKMFHSEGFLQRIREEDPSMLKHMPILQKINANGFLTIESQAGRKSKGVSVFNGKSYVMNERAYISGFLPSTVASKFIQKMNIDTDMCAIHIASSEKETLSSLDTPLTYSKFSSEIQINTHMSMSIPKKVISQWKKEKHLDSSEKVVYIFCQDAVWNRNASSKNGLFTKVLKTLEAL